MSTALVVGQERLRRIAERGVENAWRRLPGYDRADVGPFVAQAVPIVLAAQRGSVRLTEAYIARKLRRQPLGVDPADLIGAALRNGAPPREVYARPFVTVWTALKAGSAFEDAVNAGLARATGTAAMDVQMSMRATAQAVQDADPGVFGYARVADGSACQYCAMIDGAYVKSADAMPLHNHCGCGLEPLTAPHPRAAKLPSGVAVHEHGELGPVIADPADHFTSL